MTSDHESSMLSEKKDMVKNPKSEDLNQGRLIHRGTSYPSYISTLIGVRPIDPIQDSASPGPLFATGFTLRPRCVMTVTVLPIT